jgi:hypothetical protein
MQLIEQDNKVLQVMDLLQEDKVLTLVQDVQQQVVIVVKEAEKK